FSRLPGGQRGLHSFPPRRSSDLVIRALNWTGGPFEARGVSGGLKPAPAFGASLVDLTVDAETGKVTILRWTQFQDVGKAIHPSRSEEHTSELQSRENLVCRLLLE